MVLIEGVGDEVLQFVAVVIIVLVSMLAWWSTNARPDRYRTVLVMRSRAHHPVTVSIRTRSNLMLTSSPTSSSLQASITDGVPTGASTSNALDEPPRDNARVIPLQEMDSIVDADMAMLDNNRLHFYRRVDSRSNVQSAADSTSDESESQEESEPASNAQIREMDSIVSAMEADVTTGCEFFTRATESNSTTGTNKKSDNKEATSSTANTVTEQAGDTTDGASDEPAPAPAPVEPNTRKILIKLKYLNDTLREVEGSLDELLKDFKMRNFSSELSAECLVRLIFNGRVLLDDAATLRACGLHHRAVVHCLVHPKRADRQQRSIPEETSAGAGAGAAHERRGEAAPPARAWDLENMLMTLVSVALTVVWIFRCEYSNLFTASASVALFGLTLFYSVAIFGLYLSDSFQMDRRPATAPAPATATAPAPPVTPAN